MNKKGFTLIELLAVIVILAIIALIATPIVLNIIDDAKEESELRSAEFYLDALELSIAQATLDGQNIIDNTYDILKSGNLCLKYDASDKCIEELKVEVKGEIPKSGVIIIESGKIKNVSLGMENNIIVKTKDGEIAYSELDTVCTYDISSPVPEKTAGAKYECKVDPSKEPYTFYVLKTPASNDTTINLIMNKNINSDGTPAEKLITEENAENGVYNISEWISKKDYNDDANYGEYGKSNKGPITAMKFLYNATKDWVNINPLNYTYRDREYQGIQTEGVGYISFVSNNGIATITSLTDSSITIGTKDKPLRTRMPIYLDNFLENSEVGTDEYLFENLDSSLIEGYWTLSSSDYTDYFAWYASSSGYTYFNYVNNYNSNNVGVRPVINLKI